MIAAALRNAWQLNGDGLRYYQFDEIDDPDTWKGAYRAMLDSLPLDVEGKIELIGEVMLAYEFNIEMTENLAATYLQPA
jgi:heme oxygenase